MYTWSSPSPQKMFLRSPDESVITPFVLRGIELYPWFFFYMYPFPLYFRVDSSTNLLSVNKRPWNCKTLPWIFTSVVFTGIVGCGCCAYVGITQMFSLTSYQIPMFSIISVLIELVAGFLQLGLTRVVILNPVLPRMFNELFRLERKCKS